jgi:hypothetical protein
MTENLPISWQDQMKADAKSMLEAERPSLAMMSFKSGVMSIGENAVPGNEITCVIIAAVAENCWYKERYDASVKATPACYAFGEGKNQDLVPYEGSREKQHEYCYKSEGDQCPKFEWGSAENGGRGKACKERRRLALIPADGTSEMLLASIPPTSLKSWSNFVLEVAATTGRPVYGVIAKIKVVPDPKNQFVVKFSVVEPLSEPGLEAAMSKRSSALAALLQPYPELEEEETKPAKKRKF